MRQFDPRALREAFGSFTTGVTVVTTHDTQHIPLGLTVNTFTSVPIDPTVGLVCMPKS